MKNVHLCTFFIDEICDERKSRFYMEPAASVPRFACEVEQPVKQLYIRVQLLNDKFFYRKTYYCLEPPPSVASSKIDLHVNF